MLRRLLRSRDYGGLIAFLAALAILVYLLNGLLPLTSQIRLPVIGSRGSPKVDLIASLSEATPTPAAKAGTGEVAATEPPAATATPAATPTPAREIRKVGNTGGIGVYLRRTPSVNDRIRAWLDGSEMTLLGEETDAAGFHWIKVRDPAGNEGWIPQQYLVE